MGVTSHSRIFSLMVIETLTFHKNAIFSSRTWNNKQILKDMLEGVSKDGWTPMLFSREDQSYSRSSGFVTQGDLMGLSFGWDSKTEALCGMEKTPYSCSLLKGHRRQVNVYNLQFFYWWQLHSPSLFSSGRQTIYKQIKQQLTKFH